MLKLNFLSFLFKKKETITRPLINPMILNNKHDITEADILKIIKTCQDNKINTKEEALAAGIDIQEIAKRYQAGLEKKLSIEAAAKIAPYANVEGYSGKSFR